MCKWIKSGRNRIDPCIESIIENLNAIGIETVASCCGHGKYPRSIVIKRSNDCLEMISNTILHKSSKFYRKDSEGVYFIPEVTV